jgi:hypothetical protein
LEKSLFCLNMQGQKQNGLIIKIKRPNNPNIFSSSNI